MYLIEKYVYFLHSSWDPKDPKESVWLCETMYLLVFPREFNVEKNFEEVSCSAPKVLVIEAESR